MQAIYDIWFWVVTLAASSTKLLLSEHHSLRRAATTVFCAVFFAVCFTGIAVDLTGWDTENGRIAIAATLTIMGEEVTRAALRFFRTMDVSDFIDMVIRAFRGHKK